MTGAALLVETLRLHGVKTIFSLSGNQILSVYDATHDRDIELLHTRHEAAATHMADGWGRLTESPGVALVTAGPGHLDAISVLYSAQMAESPMVLLSGHPPRAQRGRGASQEIDQAGAARPVVKATSACPATSSKRPFPRPVMCRLRCAWMRRGLRTSSFAAPSICSAKRSAA